MLKEKAAALMTKFPSVKVDVVPIKNHFFGESITVAGLVTGQDLIAQLKEHGTGDLVLIPMTMLRSGEDVFLDDVHVSDAEKALGVPFFAAECDGESLVRALLGKRKTTGPEQFRPYELKEKYE